jgi:hypothetical protein|nr:MAG TPA: protein of unknown function DUF1424 [Caudoviricetes sp.]
MAYRKHTFTFPNSIEHAYKFAGHIGAKGEKRAKRKKPTPEQVKRQNQINKENKYRHLLKANFLPGDCWITLKYPAGTRKSMDAVKQDLALFDKRMRRDYAEHGESWKWIRRIEIGKRGGIHIHLICNRIWNTELLIAKNWPGLSHHSEPVRDEEGFEQLASYLCKPLPEELEQTSIFEPEEIKRASSLSSSRNLVRPEPEKKAYVRRTMKKIITDGPVARPGYYIDKKSIRIGINQVTGYSYVYYTEVKIQQTKRVIRAPGDDWPKLHRCNERKRRKCRK